MKNMLSNLYTRIFCYFHNRKRISPVVQYVRDEMLRMDSKKFTNFDDIPVGDYTYPTSGYSIRYCGDHYTMTEYERSILRKIYDDKCAEIQIITKNDMIYRMEQKLPPEYKK